MYDIFYFLSDKSKFSAQTHLVCLSNKHMEVHHVLHALCSTSTNVVALGLCPHDDKRERTAI